jgi:hypothetical protein
MGGPDGGNGVCAIFHRPGADARVRYDAETQHWEECSGGSYWVGYEKGAAPGPVDLARKAQVNGHFVELCDGQQWRVPLVRQWDGRTSLPVRIKLASDGSQLQQVSPKYEAVYNRVFSEWEEWFNAGDDYGRTFVQLVDYCSEVLSVNYHVSKWECSVIGLFDSENLREIFRAVADMDSLYEMLEAQKKTDLAPDTSGTSNG